MSKKIVLVTGVTGQDSSYLAEFLLDDGTPHKLMDISRLKALGWQAAISLEASLADTYHWFLAHQDNFRG